MQLRRKQEGQGLFVPVDLLQGVTSAHLPPSHVCRGRNRGAAGKPLLERSHPAHPSFLASCWPWRAGWGGWAGGI